MVRDHKEKQLKVVLPFLSCNIKLTSSNTNFKNHILAIMLSVDANNWNFENSSDF